MKIVRKIATRFDVPLEDFINGRRYKGMSYLRKLMVYFVRSETGLEFHYIAPLVGMTSHTCASDYNRWVFNEYKKNEKVKADVIAINQIIAA